MTDNTKTNHRPARRISRRQVLRSGRAGAALVLGGSLAAAAPCDEKPCSERKGPLQRGDRVPLAGQPEEIIQKAYELGCQYEKAEEESSEGNKAEGAPGEAEKSKGEA